MRADYVIASAVLLVGGTSLAVGLRHLRQRREGSSFILLFSGLLTLTVAVMWFGIALQLPD